MKSQLWPIKRHIVFSRPFDGFTRFLKKFVKWAAFELFLVQDLSGLSGFSKKSLQTAQTAQILLKNRSIHSKTIDNLEGV